MKSGRSSEGQRFTPRPVEWLPPDAGSADHAEVWTLARQFAAARAAGMPRLDRVFAALAETDQLSVLYVTAQGIDQLTYGEHHARCSCLPWCAAQWAAAIAVRPARTYDLARQAPGLSWPVAGRLSQVLATIGAVYASECGQTAVMWLTSAAGLDHAVLFG